LRWCISDDLARVLHFTRSAERRFAIFLLDVSVHMRAERTKTGSFSPSITRHPSTRSEPACIELVEMLRAGPSTRSELACIELVQMLRAGPSTHSELACIELVQMLRAGPSTRSEPACIELVQMLRAGPSTRTELPASSSPRCSGQALRRALSCRHRARRDAQGRPLTSHLSLLTSH
jgi:hypothetical protein